MGTKARMDVERFEEALRTGDKRAALRIWPRLKTQLRSGGGEWVPLAVLAREELMDQRTLRRRIENKPFVRYEGDRLCLVERGAYYADKAEHSRAAG